MALTGPIPGAVCSRIVSGSLRASSRRRRSITAIRSLQAWSWSRWRRASSTTRGGRPLSGSSIWRTSDLTNVRPAGAILPWFGGRFGMGLWTWGGAWDGRGQTTAGVSLRGPSVPEAFEREAVERVRTGGMTIIAAADEFGLHETPRTALGPALRRARGGARAAVLDGGLVRPLAGRSGGRERAARARECAPFDGARHRAHGRARHRPLDRWRTTARSLEGPPGEVRASGMSTRTCGRSG